MNVDTTIAIFSDMHSGSSTALFPNKFWQSSINERNHTPTARQKILYKHFRDCLTIGRNERKNKRLIVVHNGDALDGVHHGTTELVTYIKDEQIDIHIDLMDEAMKGLNFDKRKGDKLYYIQGTEVHVNDKEHRIGKDLGSEKTNDGRRVFQHLELSVNGRKIWFAHHGPKRGEGASEGDPLRNWLKKQYWKRVQEKDPIPDMIITGHTHLPCYQTYIMRDVILHGLICPSWQEKTKFGYAVAATDKNEIGAIFITITKDGHILPPLMPILRTSSEQTINL